MAKKTAQPKVETKSIRLAQYVQNFINEIDNKGLELTQDQINDTIKDCKKLYYNLKKDCSEQVNCDYKLVLEQFNKLFYQMKNDSDKIANYLKLMVSKAKNRKEIKHMNAYEYYKSVALIVAYYQAKNVAYYI